VGGWEGGGLLSTMRMPHSLTIKLGAPTICLSGPFRPSLSQTWSTACDLTCAFTRSYLVGLARACNAQMGLCTASHLSS
jgi:hypothetical protein